MARAGAIDRCGNAGNRSQFVDRTCQTYSDIVNDLVHMGTRKPVSANNNRYNGNIYSTFLIMVVVSMVSYLARKGSLPLQGMHRAIPLRYHENILLFQIQTMVSGDTLREMVSPPYYDIIVQDITGPWYR